jgi:hypothetical protein
MRHRVVTALVLGASVAAGCGESVEAQRGDDAPAITAPGTTIPYESGGADGSGSDGSEAVDDRGGIAAGPDSREPGEDQGADDEFKPPRSGSDSP